MTERNPPDEETTLEVDSEDHFEGSTEHTMLMAELDVRYYNTSLGVADCGARMGSFCGNFLFRDLQVAPDMDEAARDEIEKELAWFQAQWERRMTRLGERLQKAYRIDETPRPAFAFTKEGVFFTMGIGREKRPS